MPVGPAVPRRLATNTISRELSCLRYARLSIRPRYVQCHPSHRGPNGLHHSLWGTTNTSAIGDQNAWGRPDSDRFMRWQWTIFCPDSVTDISVCRLARNRVRRPSPRPHLRACQHISDRDSLACAASARAACLMAQGVSRQQRATPEMRMGVYRNVRRPSSTGGAIL